MREGALPAIYLRLSQADGDKAESDSIENQRRLLKRIVSELPDYARRAAGGGEAACLEYMDDGYSGGNFNRPGFQQMLSDCRRGRISCILVKDLSRFGRNFLEVNTYLEDVFPSLKIRFIAVGEGYDSGKDGVLYGRAPDLDLQISGILNAWYLKDIACKSAAGMVCKWRRGELTSTHTPLGYICRDVKEGWKVDEDGMKIVKLVFSLALEGLTTSRIADRLNSQGISTPYRYLSEKGLWRGRSYRTQKDRMVWDTNAVANILKNETYTGTLIQGKCRRTSSGAGGGTVASLSPDAGTGAFRVGGAGGGAFQFSGTGQKAPQVMEWRHEGMHEAAVSREEFLAAQSAIRHKGGQKRRTLDYVLKGKVRCRGCGRIMVRSSKGVFYCNSGGKTSEKCRGRYKEEELVGIVTGDLIAAGKRCARRLEELERPEFDFASKEKEGEALRNAQMQKYEAYVRGTVTKEEYCRIQADIRLRIGEINEQIVEWRRALSAFEKMQDVLSPYADAAAAIETGGLTRDIVKELVRTVWASPEGVETELSVCS